MKLALFVCPLVLLAATAPEHFSDVAIDSHIFKPHEMPAPDLASLHVPPGFRIEKFADNAGNIRIMAVGPDGSVYVTRRDEGDVMMYRTGANGLAAGPPVRVASRSGLHGIAFSKGKVYLASVHEVFSADVQSDGAFGPLKMLIHDLPDAGQHNTRTIQIGPDDMMYIAVGSTCNECAEPNPENATLLRASLDGKTRSIFASGLRDTIGWGWHPDTGEIWGMDHGIDMLGDNDQPEELNHIEKGKNYGWPYVYADGKLNPHLDPPAGIKKAQWAAESRPMVLGYTAHAAPMQLSFYTGSQFPAEYRGDAFISLRGSWNRKPASGYEVARIHFVNGQAKSIQPFVTGFVRGDSEYGRLVGNAMAKDGSLLFGDDRNGVIYRVSYVGGQGAANASANQARLAPAEPMIRQNHTGEKKPLALERPEAQTAAKLTVTSPAFANGSAIPAVHSSYDQNASPELHWSAGPAGTKSYAIILEDPDASTTPLPVVHWIAWNLPGDVLKVREGLQMLERLENPEGLRQGVNSAGVVGYRGPKPPEGDPRHHYHFQVFAVDQMLNLPLRANRDDLLAALRGHVRAGGELIGTFARPAQPAKP